MDSTSTLGRNRAVERDAVRILTVVHQLGERSAASDLASAWFIDTESQLQHLDHLVRHPIDLAYVLIDQIRSRSLEGAEVGDSEAQLRQLAGRVRRLLAGVSGQGRAGSKRQGRHRPSLLRPFDAGSWQRWDDALAVLTCRGLLRVAPLAVEASPDADVRSTAELRYRLTEGGAHWLQDSVYPSQQDSKTTGQVLERCRLLKDVLPVGLLQPQSATLLGQYLQDTAQHLEAYRHDEQIRPEDDLLANLFQSTFAEVL